MTTSDEPVSAENRVRVRRHFLGRPAIEALAVLLGLTALLCLAFWRFLLPVDNPASLFFRCDFWGQQYPNILFGRQAVLDHSLPFWEPYSNLGGRPAFAEAVRSYSYLPNLITFGIGAWLSPEAYQTFWVFRVLMHIAAGGTAVYLLMRRWTYGWAAGWLAAVLFCFAGFQQATMHLANFTDGFALLPWVLLLWQWSQERFSFLRLTVLAVVLSQLLCAAYQNLYIYAFLLVMASTLVEALGSDLSARSLFKRIGKETALVGAVFLCGVLLALVQVLPSMQAVGQSYRSDAQGLEWSMAYQRVPYQVFELFWPSFFSTTTSIPLFWKYENVSLYVGIIPLLLIPLTFLDGRRSQHRTASVRWLLITMPFVVLTFSGETRLHDLLYLTVPLYGFFRASNNAWAVAMMGIAILSGISLDRLVAGKGRAVLPGRVVAVGGGVVFASLVLLVPLALEFLAAKPANGFEHILGQIGQLLFWAVLIVAGVLSLRSQPIAGAVLLIAVAFLDLSGQLGKNLFCNHGSVSPAVIFEDNRLIAELRLLVAGHHGPVRVRFAQGMPQYSVVEHYRLFTDKGHSVIETPQNQHVAFLTGSPGHPFANIAYDVTYAPIPNRTPIRELSVTAEEARRRVYANIDGFGLAGRKAGDQIFIYQNEDVYPRAYFVKELQVVVAPQDLEAAFSRTDMRTVAFVAQDDLPRAIPTGERDISENEVTNVAYEANAVTIDVRAPHDGILVVSDTYLPGWRVFSEGTELTLFRVNGKFRGVLVPAGAKRLTFQYSAPGFKTGALVSSLTLCALVLLCLFERRRRP